MQKADEADNDKNSHQFGSLYEQCREMIFTTQPESETIGLNEMMALDGGVKLRVWLDQGVGLVELGRSYADFLAVVRENPPVFIRHLAPVQTKKELTGDEADLDVMSKDVNDFISYMDITRTFSIQTRFFGKEERPYTSFQLNERLAGFLTGRGLLLDVGHPEQVISLVLRGNTCFLGLSLAEDNLSDWAGGKQRFTREEGLISRAEFKLMEAIDVFKLRIPMNGTALDLGAAPGGWTRVLRRYGLRVVAVDPAELHPDVVADPGVTHLKQTAQVFLGTEQEFDMVVNDMKMDLKDSTELMALAEKSLKPGGLAIMTLKLPHSGWQKKTQQAIHYLKKTYQIIGARQLFHNRSEVTVVMMKV